MAMQAIIRSETKKNNGLVQTLNEKPRSGLLICCIRGHFDQNGIITMYLHGEMDSGSFSGESGFTGGDWLAEKGDGEFWVSGL